VGLKNYVDIFTGDKVFYKSLHVTLIYVIIAVPLKLAFALFIAMILNLKLRYVNFFRTVYYMPSILGGSVAVSILWKFLFGRQGVINQMTAAFGIPAVDWLGNPNLALYTISILTVWQFGSSMVVFLAGLKQIPAELYDAAKVDGAGRIRIFFNITMPLITPMIFFNLIMQMIHAFQEFTAAFVITSGGPLKSTYLYGILLYDNAFNFFKMGTPRRSPGSCSPSSWSSRRWYSGHPTTGRTTKTRGSSDMKLRGPNNLLTYFFLSLLGLFMVYPLLWLLGSSFKPNEDIFTSLGLIPKRLVFDAYAKGWKGSGQYSYTTFFVNTFVLVIPQVAATIVSSSLAAYGSPASGFPSRRRSSC
jgi:oligogalacturonide transport system permease protein